MSSNAVRKSIESAIVDCHLGPTCQTSIASTIHNDVASVSSASDQISPIYSEEKSDIISPCIPQLPLPALSNDIALLVLFGNNKTPSILQLSTVNCNGDVSPPVLPKRKSTSRTESLSSGSTRSPQSQDGDRYQSTKSIDQQSQKSLQRPPLSPCFKKTTHVIPLETDCSKSRNSNNNSTPSPSTPSPNIMYEHSAFPKFNSISNIVTTLNVDNNFKYIYNGSKADWDKTTQVVLPQAAINSTSAHDLIHYKNQDNGKTSPPLTAQDVLPDTFTSYITSKSSYKNHKPPPLSPVVISSIQKSLSNGKISSRQDSNVSSDSYSQNSSPSYTNKTMEAPLLPYHAMATRTHANGNIVKKIIGMGNKNKPRCNETNVSNGNISPITKSMSTPASLQTIVRFHNGSNMSLRHRIIRDMRRPSSHYANLVKTRFRFAQVLINAIALLAVSGGLAAYLKAYPSAIQQENNVATVQSTIAQNSFNPAPGICLPVIVSFCLNHKIPYNYTVFPNYMGHFTQRDAEQELEVYDAVVDVRCYELAALFLCSVFVPKCGLTGQVVRPCRSLCFETKRRCGFFLDVFGLSLPDYLECGLFPESPDLEVCIGHKEVKEAKLRAEKPVCPTGFQCDEKRCIPADWKCDGHIDCKDQSDELNCKPCPKGKIHCGEDRCMTQEHLCDGVDDCPWGQDERNCLRLSDSNGDEGRGELEVFMPSHQKWVPACVTHWDPANSAKDVCSLLGYSSSNWSQLGVKGDSGISPGRDAISMWPLTKKKKTNIVKEIGTCAGNSYLTVNLTCTDYACGKIKKFNHHRITKRIIGGVESQPGDWPFLAALLGGPEEIFYCAGVLIADQWVLTASHCVGNHSDVSGWTIQLGITRRRSHSYYGQKMKVRRVVPHPMYNLGAAHDNDVALFQLESRVTFHEHLLPVCLPPPDIDLTPGTVCTVIGWGKREDKEMSEYEPAVNEVQVPIIKRELCNQWLEHRDLNVTEGMICAGYPEGGKDACQGDSGGPLLCQDDSESKRWFVGGIVSWGIKCAHPHLPGVYAYVPRYISWINQQISLYSK